MKTKPDLWFTMATASELRNAASTTAAFLADAGLAADEMDSVARAFAMRELLHCPGFLHAVARRELAALLGLSATNQQGALAEARDRARAVADVLDRALALLGTPTGQTLAVVEQLALAAVIPQPSSRRKPRPMTV